MSLGPGPVRGAFGLVSAGFEQGVGCMAQDTPTRENNVTRRGFVRWAVGAGAGFVAVAAGVPIIASVVVPFGQAKQGAYVRVAALNDIPVGEPYGISFVEESQDAYQYSMLPHSAYVLKTSDTEVVVYSPVCPHLGCQVFFDRQKREYVCPCHNSVFAADGARVSGPTPRSLDTLPSKIEKGDLFVQWVQFKPGVSDKTPV